MHSSAKMRRLDQGKMKRAIVAFAIAGALAVTAMGAVINDGGSSDSGRDVANAGAVTIQHPLGDFGYQGLRPALPTDGATPDVGTFMDYTFMEQNLNLPTSSARPVPARDYRFLEMNLDLPGSSSSTAADWKVIEENSWGEDFVFESPATDNPYPNADDVPQLLSGQVRY